MIRLAFALCALLALGDALAQDMREVNDCMQKVIGWTCPDSANVPGRRPNRLERIMTWDPAKLYCECRILNQWAPASDDQCLALSRVCEFGDI